MQDRGRAIAPDVILLAQLAPPQLFALQIEGDKSRRAQPDVNPLAVSDRRRRALRIGRVGSIGARIVEPGLPECLAAGAFEAKQGAAFFLFERLREVNAVTRDDGRRVAAFSERDPPANVF